MLEIMNWIAQDASHFAGTLLFLYVLTMCVIWVIEAIRGK